MEAKQDSATRVDTAELLEAAKLHLLGNYRPAEMILVKGRGCELFDADGGRYLDFCAGVAVCCLGHAHPDLVAAIADQAATLMQVSNYFYNAENVQLARELCQVTGYHRAFFCNSGAEANEAMLKLCRRYHHEQGAPRTRVLAFERAFHGRTMGALALTGTPAYKVGFGAPLADIEHVPYGDLDQVRARMADDVAAIFVEPVQGEGGVIVPERSFMTGLRELCDHHGTLLMCDEVQVGIGRTGTMLGSHHSGVRADAIALAKGLGGGVPIGVMLVDERLADALPPGAHGSTFGGNPLASRAARTVLQVIERDGLLEAARLKGARLAAGLAKLAAKHSELCTGSRGLGLLQAITLSDKTTARDLLINARNNGLLVTAAGPAALRFTPPLIVSDAEIDEALALTDATLSAVNGG